MYDHYSNCCRITTQVKKPMKKLILYILIFGIHTTAQSQYVSEVNTLSLHNSCVTAAKVCVKKRIKTDKTLGRPSCEDSLSPQYFKFKMSASGHIVLQTSTHTGTYTLYGPMTSLGINSCEQIALGQVNQVNGTLSGTISIPHVQGFYMLRVSLTSCISVGDSYSVDINVSSERSRCIEEPPCIDCLSSFSPGPGNYLVSGWVKGEQQNKNTSYINPSISVSFDGAPDSTSFLPSGLIIDGWQRIDGAVTVPNAATGIKIGLYCKTGQCLFDDIRFIPVDASMVSYVYDPVTSKLVAQLDGRNYATLYEYDEQGKLIRTKKETERGIMTIQEVRDNLYNK